VASDEDGHVRILGASRAEDESGVEARDLAE
jgi:hypothetical protein